VVRSPGPKRSARLRGRINSINTPEDHSFPHSMGGSGRRSHSGYTFIDSAHGSSVVPNRPGHPFEERRLDAWPVPKFR